MTYNGPKFLRESFRPLSFVFLGAILVFSAVIAVPHFSDWLRFAQLQVMSEETHKATRLALRLRDTRGGINLALKDMNCYGGKTRGWSSWILETSPRSSEVETGLGRILADTKQELGRRVEAAIILWKRSKDPVRLLQCYELVQKAGGPTVAIGRRRLVLSANLQALRSRIDVPGDEDAKVSTNELFTQPSHKRESLADFPRFQKKFGTGSRNVI